MKKLILIIGFLFVFIFGYSQTSVIRPYVNAGLLNGQLSTYYLDTSSLAQTKSGKLTLNGGLVIGTATTGIDFTGTYTGNVIDLSNITIDYTGSSGPAPIRIGTYDSPLTNADEDQSGFLRLYGQTSANGTSYDRGIFMTLKTTGTKGIFPIAGLAEVLAQAGAGPTSVTAGQFIADLHTTDAVLAATTGGGEGMYGAWFKVTAIDGATTNANSVIAPIWVDNQLYGNNAATTNKEYGIRATTGGTKPKSFIGFETTSVGWDQLFYFDATAYDQAPVSNNALKVLLNTTQYYLPLSTLSTSFTVNDGTVSNPSIAFASDLNTGIYTTGADAISISAGGVEAARFVESTTTQLLVGNGTSSLPSISFITDSNSGFFLEGVDDLRLGINGANTYRFRSSEFANIGIAGFYMRIGTLSGTNPTYSFNSDTDTGVGFAGADSLSLIAGGVEGIRIAEGGGKIKVTVTDTLQVNGTYNGYQTDGTTSLYWHEYNISAFSISTGASGATLTAPTANTLGGYQLDVNTEQLYYSSHIEADWDGTTDIIMEVWWEVNEAAADDGTVDLQLISYYKGDHESANKTQTEEVPVTITGNKAQFTQHMTTFTINFDEGGNVVDAEDVISFILNLETDTSECDDIIINYAELKYQTTKPNPETY